MYLSELVKLLNSEMDIEGLPHILHIHTITKLQVYCDNYN